MRYSFSKAALSTSSAALLATASLVLPLANQPAAQAGEHCDPRTINTVRFIDAQPLAMTTGRAENGSSVVNPITHTYQNSGSQSATVTGEMSMTAKAAVAEVNAKAGIAVATSASVTEGVAFTINVPAHSRVTYSYGLETVRARINHKQIFSNCQSKNTSTQLSAPRWVEEVKPDPM